MDVSFSNARKFLWILGAISIVTSVSCALVPLNNNVTRVAFYVSGLINNCKEKHRDDFNVLFFSVGPKTDLIEEVLGNISSSSAVISASPNDCQKLENRKGAVVIIETDVWEKVKEVELFIIRNLSFFTHFHR
jgi:hypothetical protein